MNVYLDFEATQYKENIIAIGAHCAYGDFDCLVQPPKGDKITSYITQLTNITKEMLVDAPTIDTAFYDLYQWLTQVSDGPTFFHVYGDMDKIFLEHAAAQIDDPCLKDFASSLAASVIDDSLKVRRFFHTKAIGVYRALRYFIPELPEQDHDPLNDAIALAQLMNYISYTTPLEDCPFEECKPQLKKEKSEHQKRQYTITVTHLTDSAAKQKIFHSYGEATNRAFTKIRAKYPNATLTTVKKHVAKAIDTNGSYMGWGWQKEYIVEKEK